MRSRRLRPTGVGGTGIVKTLAIKVRMLVQRESSCPLLFSLNEPASWQYNVPRPVFQPLSFHKGGKEDHSVDSNPRAQLFRAYRLSLRRHNLGSTGCLQFESGIRNLLIQLDIRILRQAIIARRFEELLLDGYTPRGVHP